MKNDKVFTYSDRVSELWLWQKAMFLVPLWGLAAVPIFGALSSLFGQSGIQLGFTLTLGSLIAYFIEDVLKTKVRIGENHLYHGYRVLDLRTLAAVSLQYKPKQMLPTSIVLSFTDGRKHKLKISRLQATDSEALLKLIETRYPGAKIDPVLRTLSKCKRVAQTTALDTQSKVEIPYQSRQVFRQLWDTFVESTEKWKRAGPLLCAALFGMVWINTVAGLYSALSAMGSSQTFNDLQARTMLQHLFENANNGVGNAISSTGNLLATVLSHPVFAGFMLMVLFALAIQSIQYLLRPNMLVVDEAGITSCLRMGLYSGIVGQANWNNIVSVCLLKPARASQSEKATICFMGKNDKPVLKLKLSAIALEHRVRLLKAIERLAPQCTIDPSLSEALLPKQNRSYTELWLQSLAAPPERKSLEPLTAGSKLNDDRFEVVRRLGIGGQGTAYLCRDNSALEENMQPEVVLKETILPAFVEQTIKQQALERFQKEAELLERLDSDSIVRLIDYFIEDHRGYLVLEHIDGKTLRQLVEENGPLGEEQARDLALKMCDILQYLHERGIVHRDFTPDNMILSRSGNLKLIDFNVAQMTASGATGTIVGKHAFVPPEQFRGKPTTQSDIYAMGASLYFLVTGNDPEPISQSNPQATGTNVSGQFAQVVAACTALQQEKRMQTADEVKQALMQLFVAEEGVRLNVSDALRTT